MQGSELSVVCEGLLSKIFQPAQEQKRGFVVLVTSMHPRAGVTQITKAMADSLSRKGTNLRSCSTREERRWRKK